MKAALVIIFVLLGVALSAIILMQEGQEEGLGSISGIADTYWAKNKSRSLEGNLVKFTRVGAVAFFVLALILDVIW